MKWQPIDTAPKDGTWVMLWRGAAVVGDWDPIVIARFQGDIYEDEYGFWVWPEPPFSPFTEKGRARAERHIEKGDIFYCNTFTHWMPLPEPPQDATTARTSDDQP